MKSIEYNPTNQVLRIFENGKPHDVPVEPGWQGMGIAVVGIVAAMADEMHGLQLDNEERDQVARVLTQHGF